jgi:hypothetical protein
MRLVAGQGCVSVKLALLKEQGALLKDQSKGSTRGSISALAASVASKLARNAPAPSDPLEGAIPTFGEDSIIRESDRLDENPPARQVASQMPHDQPPGTKPTSTEYRIRADTCLHWVGEAPTDEIRLACLTLATAWLKAAIDEDGRVSDHLPLAPRL